MTDHLDGFGGSVVAAELAFETMPPWLREATLHRWVGARDAAHLSWHIFARAAVDESELPIIHRGALRVLIDWHNGRTRTVEPRQTEIARRIPAARQKTNAALRDLIAWGWLHALERPGRPSILTLLCPVDDPALRAASGVRPVTVGDTPPVTVGDTPVTVGDTPCHRGGHHRGTGEQGNISGEHVLSARDAFGARAVDAGEKILPTTTIDKLPDGATWEHFYDPGIREA